MTQDPRTELADLVAQLVEPVRHAEEYTLRPAIPGGGHTQEIRIWRTVHPSLLDQLATAIEPSSSTEAGARGYESSPAARIDAIDMEMRIQLGAAMWCDSLGLVLRDDPRTNLRALVGATLDDDTLTVLVLDVRRWVTWARVVTGWDVPPRRLIGPCLACGMVGTLRARTTPVSAVCVECGATWDEASVGILAEHLQRAKRDAGSDTGELERIAG